MFDLIFTLNNSPDIEPNQLYSIHILWELKNNQEFYSYKGDS
jgi:hypothetical protein